MIVQQERLILEQQQPQIQIYDFDPTRPEIYSPLCAERYLVNIMIGKIDGPLRAHLSGDEKIIDIILKYTKLGILYDKRWTEFREEQRDRKRKTEYSL